MFWRKKRHTEEELMRAKREAAEVERREREIKALEKAVSSGREDMVTDLERLFHRRAKHG